MNARVAEGEKPDNARYKNVAGIVITTAHRFGDILLQMQLTYCNSFVNVKNTIEATIDICNPEIASICAVPDIINLSRTSVGIADLSPVINALAIPPAGDGSF